jgi:hypothetical protein
MRRLAAIALGSSAARAACAACGRRRATAPGDGGPGPQPDRGHDERLRARDARGPAGSAQAHGPATPPGGGLMSTVDVSPAWTDPGIPISAHDRWSRGVGLSGLEPLTSSLSGKRSNRLSYRPPAAPPGVGRPERLPHTRGGPQTGWTPEGNARRPAAPGRVSPQWSSSASVTSRPPSRLAARLYRNAPSVAIAVSSTTSSTATSIVMDSTRSMPM